METLKRIKGPPTTPGWYWLKRNGLSERDIPEYLGQPAIESKWDIEWHAGPIPEPAVVNLTTMTEAYAERARQVRESREGLSSLRTGTDDGDYIFDDNGYVASCRTASIASEFVEAVNQHGSLVRLREAVERFADTTKAWTWSSREEQELVNDIMQALRAAQKEGKL